MSRATAAEEAVSTPVSTNGMLNRSSVSDTAGLISTPARTNPSTIDATVAPSIQPLASTSCSDGSSSVRIPYLAGEYAAAPRPTTAYASSGCAPVSITAQPTIFTMLVMSITRPLGIESANGPTSGASTTYETTKTCFSAGVIQAGAAISPSRPIAAMSSALSATELKN